MSSRALRRLQKESEHQQRAKNHNDISSSDEEPTKPKAQNLFDMLGDADDEDLGSEPKESVPDDQDVATQTKSPDAQPSSGKKKKKRKKAQNKHKEKSSNLNEMVETAIKSKKNTDQLDEIDRALQSLSTKPKDASSIISNPKADEEYLQSCRMLSIDSKQLNALNEMKRLFGNAVLDGDKEEAEAAAPTRRRGRGPQQLDLGGALAGRNSPASKGQGLAKLALRRNVFMVGKEEWPKATSGGLGMEVTKKWDDGTIEYRFVHNSGYQDVQRQFEVCVESMDPQRMIQMLQFNRKITYSSA